MFLADNCHLTYCTNIHPGESWEETFNQLKTHLHAVKKQVQSDGLMGLGLRLSNRASVELMDGQMESFKTWLSENDAYVFTMNGFPYGTFHHHRVKDMVHHPDWRTDDRVEYTIRLAEQLAELLPQGMEGGISTSPLSYQHWFSTQTSITTAYIQSTYNILKVAEKLIRLRDESGIFIHLDIEPEPDGLLGTVSEFISWYDEYLLPEGIKYLKNRLGIDAKLSEQLLREHVQLCYDVCHLSVSFEDHLEVLKTLRKKGIGVGKVQLSAALKVIFDDKQQEKLSQIKKFNDEVYLHQVKAKMQDNSFRDFYDLSPAIHHYSHKHKEWRVHYHVPLFTERFDELLSTQQDVVKVLQEYAKEPFSAHLEVETYTWEVLPVDLRMTIDKSIARELNWVKKQLEQ